jgi:DNA-binding transcriptional LysR family regulator
MALIPKYQCTRSQTLISMAEAGLGAAILPCSVLPSPIPEDTQVARIVEPTITRQMAIITTPSRVLSPAAARLAELVREMITPRGHLHEAPDAGAHPATGTERFLPY